MNPPRDRDELFDLARGLGIILVVYGHVARGLHNAGFAFPGDTYGLVDSVLYSFHMPLFFILSGLFLPDAWGRRTPMRFIGAKIDNILYVYLVWSILQGSIEVVLAAYTNGTTSWQEVARLWVPRAQFWFLYALFFYFLLAAALRALLTPGTAMTAMLVIALATALVAPMLGGIGSKLAGHLPYFTLGVLLSGHRQYLERLVRYAPTGAAAALAFAAAILWPGNPAGSPGENTLLLPAVLAATTGSLALLACAHLLKGNRLILHLGRKSLEIYLMHILAASGTRIFLDRILGIESLPIHLAAGLVAGIGLPLLFLYLEAKLSLPTKALWRARPPIALESRLH